ncbi:MAG: pyruvate kinase [Alphaproteobacteria bacterium]
MMKFTKITASVGPKSDAHAVLTKMVRAGVNLFRINFSHDTGDVQGKKIDTIRTVAHELKTPIAVVVDLQGPKHRIGNFATEEKYKLTIGQRFVFDSDETPGDNTRVCLPHPDVIASMRPGDRILLNDGKIEMRVDRTEPTKIIATVVRGNEIWSRRGFNLPDTFVDGSVLTDKDMADLEYAITKNPDYVAVSFVQSADDIAYVRDFITARTAHKIKIIAKIERPHAVHDIDNIVAISDGIMIARGDLAVEMPFEQVPAISRHIIRVCRQMNKPVIMATQMLASMVESEFPTRAEISDVANAAYLRADSCMTSEETTIGVNPTHTVETMSRILSYADMDTIANPYDWSRIDNIPENNWSRSVASMAHLNNASAIVVFDRDGIATTQISCRRPDMPIVAVCNDETVANQLCLSRGVFPIYDTEMFGRRDTDAAVKTLKIKMGAIVIVDDGTISLREL